MSHSLQSHSSAFSYWEAPLGSWDWSALLKSNSVIAVSFTLSAQTFPAGWKIEQFNSLCRPGVSQTVSISLYSSFSIFCFSYLLSLFPPHLTCHETTHLFLLVWLPAISNPGFDWAMCLIITYLGYADANEQMPWTKIPDVTAPVGIFSGWHFGVIRLSCFFGFPGKRFDILFCLW